jgi:hypothetical protein
MAGACDGALAAMDVTPPAAAATTAAAAAPVAKPLTRVFTVTAVLSIGPTEVKG